MERFAGGLAEAGAGRSAEELARPELEQALAAALQAGLDAVPTLGLDAAVFATHLGRCLASYPPEVGLADALRDCQAADIYVACGAGNGIAAAIAIVAGKLLDGSVAATVRRIDDNVGFVSEVMQILREKLLVGAEGQRPKILSFGGRAPLSVWLAAAAQTTALSLQRAGNVQARLKTRVAAEAQVAALDPELRYLQAQYADRFEEAFHHALARLSDRGRMVLRLHSFLGMTLDQLAAVYSVNPATISRWFARAREDLLDETAKYMRDTFGVSPAELPSLARVLVSQLDLSLARLLGGSAPGGDAGPRR
ncbi:MAG TPA: sigma-70 family RNA polymerase sigma factor [Polyangia bacterium]|jgi:RNA polymerase sigma-70 factor (ECF subfamily)|nr:sigma-70 family RNA polymerase sigma factor [Polyangia bacterium]